MSLIVALPMYPVPRAALATFWRGLRLHLERAGLEHVPDSLTTPDDYAAHWLEPDLLLSQTCGYPLTGSLAGRVRYVATPEYAAEGCRGPFYRSAIVVRADEPVASLAGMTGRIAAYNTDDSQSGMNALRAMVAPLATGGRFFGGVVRTGGHRLSIEAVRSGTADLAAIDAVTWALVSRDEPAAVAGLRVLAFTAEAPGLPFVTSIRSSDDVVARLRAALITACSDPSLAAARSAMLLNGVAVLPASSYAVIPQMEAEAMEAGYPYLN